MPGKDSTYETPNPIILSPCLLIPIIGIPIAIGTISILTNNLSDAQRLAFEQGDVLGFLSMMPDSMQGNLGTYMPIIAVIIIATLCVMLVTWSNESQKLNAEGSDLGNVKIKRGKEARRGFKAWNGDELAPKGFACGCDDAGGLLYKPLGAGSYGNSCRRYRYW